MSQAGDNYMEAHGGRSQALGERLFEDIVRRETDFFVTQT
jgi:hypothetical protein